MSNLVVDAVPQTQTGVASGMNANIRTVGGALGGAVLASVVTAGARPDGLPVESGYVHGFTAAGRHLGAGRAGRRCSCPVVRARTHVVPGPQAEAEAAPGSEPGPVGRRAARSCFSSSRSTTGSSSSATTSVSSATRRCSWRFSCTSASSAVSPPAHPELVATDAAVAVAGDGESRLEVGHAALLFWGPGRRKVTSHPAHAGVVLVEHVHAGAELLEEDPPAGRLDLTAYGGRVDAPYEAGRRRVRPRRGGR